MPEVTIRELRNHGGEVVDRVAHGEPVVITRSGRPVAELRPIRPRPVPASALLERWRRLPAVDPAAFRADLDLAASLRRAGPKPAARASDAMIAATAMANSLSVHTCNPDDFRAIDGLDVVTVPHPDRPA